MAEWLKVMEPVAYGALALKPWEFGRLTVDEFQKLVEGYEWRQEQNRLTLAQFALPIINSCARNLKKPITIENLLGYDLSKKLQAERKKKKSGEELRVELKNLKDEWR